MTSHLTRTEYAALEEAYDFFNQCLFNGQLPPCLMTLNRHRHARGYFAAERFGHREQEQRTDEIALNPDTFEQRTDLEILSTLVHEQCHLWQHHFGKTSRNGYHNKQWAEKMEAIGLMPSDTAAPGGKRTGQSVTHYLLPGGAFERAALELLAQQFKLSWQSPASLRKPTPKK